MIVIATVKVGILNFVKQKSISFFILPEAKHQLKKNTPDIYQLRKYFWVILVKWVEIGNSVQLLIMLNWTEFKEISYFINDVSLNIL